MRSATFLLLSGLAVEHGKNSRTTSVLLHLINFVDLNQVRRRVSYVPNLLSRFLHTKSIMLNCCLIGILGLDQSMSSYRNKDHLQKNYGYVRNDNEAG